MDRQQRRRWYDDDDDDDGWYRDPDEVRGRRYGSGQRPRAESTPLPSGPGYVTSRRRSEPAPADKPAPRAESAPSFRTGQKVRHARFGDGIVVESKVTGDDEEVTVAFKNTGIKKLAASFANLERLD